MSGVWAFFKKHKTIFLILGGVVLLYLVYRAASGSSASTSSTADDSALDEAQIAAQAQQAQTAAAFAAQQDQEQFQLTSLNDTGQIQTQQQVNQINGSLQLANIQANSANLQTTDSLQLGEAETAANVSMAGILANEQVAINASNNQTQQVGYNDTAAVGIAQTQATIAQANANAGAAESIASANEGSSAISSIAGVAGLAAAFF
jgi:hypothetical protein